MDFSRVSSALSEIEEYNATYEDALPITREQGRFMHCLIRASRPARIIELGTSTGYSTIWLASAAAGYGGVVETIEFDQNKINIAEENFGKAGIADHIIQRKADINEIIKTILPGIGFVFMDSEKQEYLDQFKILLPKLIQGAIVVADNVVDLAEDCREYIDYVKNLDTVISETVPIGNGMEVTVKK
jgi:predicted O-methyltransferase YrrM